MQSTTKLISQLNITEEIEEDELRKLAEIVEEELQIENEVNEEFEELALKLNEAVHILEKQRETTNKTKQNQKTQIKSLNEHEMVGNESILEEMKQRQNEQKEIETKMIETENKYKTEWMTDSISIDKEFVDLETENQRLNDEMKEYERKIKENETIFDELQKEIEIKRESIFKNDKEKEQFLSSINKRNQEIERCLERIQCLEREITEKEAQIGNEKLNVLGIGNELEILRGFKVNEDTLDEEMVNINKLKIKNKESEELNRSLQTQIDEIYIKLENFSENQILPLQAIMSSNEPILKSKNKQKQDLLLQIQNKEQILAKMENERAKKENDLQKSMENGTILDDKIKEKQTELNEMTENIENRKQEFIELKDEITKMRKWSVGLIEDKQRMEYYMMQKQRDPLLRFTESELNGDFGIDSGGRDLEICGSELIVLQNKVQKEQNEWNVSNESAYRLVLNPLKEVYEKHKELEFKNKEEQSALGQALKQKQQFAADIDSMNNIEIPTVQKANEKLQKEIHAMKIRPGEEKEETKRILYNLDEFGAKTLKAIDKLHRDHIAVKKRLQRKNDEMSKNNIDGIHNLKKELNDEKSKYQHLKVELRKIQRKIK